jgi:N-acetylmuramoyl-L-alanine amidase
LNEKRKKLILALCVIFAANMLAIALISAAHADLYKRGATGATVTEIQRRLKAWGYYDGAVDGVYGSRTEAAVRYFQRKNGLSVDGQVGDRTLAALGIPSSGGGGGSRGGSYDGDLQLLARIISAEARGEPYQGQVAVGAVVLNRVRHPSFPDTISGVIYQTDAFTAVSDGQFNKPIAESAYRAAQDALNGSDPSGGALYYFNPATATSAWIWSRPLLVTIGNHRFCA